MEYEELEKLAHAVCSKLETPPIITARQARGENYQWASCDSYESPKGWWWAEIGTDHGPESADDDNVEWRPVQEITEDIGDAWRLIEDMKDMGWLISLNQCVDGWIATGRRYVIDNGDWTDAVLTSDIVQEVGDTAPEAICKAFLAAMK